MSLTGSFTCCTKSFPCPICGDTDHCSVLKTRRIVCCRNPLANEGEARHDKDGRDYWVHRLDAPAGALLAEIPDAPPIAPIETLHTVYQMYLTICSTLQGGGLLPRHQESLLARGLSLEAIAAGDYASCPDEAQRARAAQFLLQQFGAETCRLVPGLTEKDGEWSVMGLPGILVPVRNPEGQIVSLKLRRDVPDMKGNRYLTISSSSAGGPIAHRAVHFPQGGTIEISRVRLTEGELKADVVQRRTRVNTFSLPGVGAWKQAVPALKYFERRINEGALGAAIETVLVAFDADARRKATVAMCLLNLVTSLREAGYRVALEVWPEGAGKGLDDLLLKGGTPELLEEEQVDEEIALCLKQAGVKTFREHLTEIVTAVEAAGTLLPLTEKGEWLNVVLDADLDRPRDYLWFEAELERVLPAKVRFKATLKRLLRVQELERKADETDEQMKQDDGGLPAIETYDRTTVDVGRDALAALVAANEPPVLFNQGGKLIQLHEREGERVPVEVRMADMQHWLDKSARWVETKSKRPVLVPAPPRIAQDLLAGGRDFSPFPELRGIVHTPLLDRNGNLVATAGYHREARLFYQPKGDLPLNFSEAPDLKEAIAAKEWVERCMFRTLAFDSEAAKAHAWALYLLPFVREMIEGPTPLHIINAPKEGTGKGLTNFVCTSPFVPGGPKVRTQPKTNEEWGKALLGYLEEGDSHMYFDNASYRLDSGTLALCLTERVFANRRLGTNTSVAVPVRCVWSVTGNNVEVSPEIARRSVWIGLDANCEDPARRSYDVDLKQFVRENRAQAVWAALTCVRWWIKNGKPLWTGSSMGSYEQWVEVMGGILMMIDVEGFLANQQTALEEYNSEALGWRAFTSEWWARHGDQEVRARDLTELADVLPFWEEIDGARSSAVAFGKRLEKQRNLIYLGKKLTARVVCNQKVYRLQVMDETEHKKDLAERARGLAEAA